MRLNPRQKRYALQSILFGLIWLFSAIIYAILELGLLGNSSHYPSTGNIYNFKTSLLVTGSTSFVIGCFLGWIEVTWLRKRFSRNPLWLKIIAKAIFYLGFIFLFIIGISTLASSILLDAVPWDPEVTENLQEFVGNFAFLSVIIYIGVTLLFSLIFSEIVEYFGMTLMYDFLLGRYHRPNQENRIFMFLDMKSSTTIAEEIGHANYFNLIKKYYADMTDPILETYGEIYQYVGDEIVVSWIDHKGIKNNNCIECFRKISERIEKNREQYTKQFDLLPEFKASFHIGEVTTGEIGIIKKDIIYTGDVLNTTARIQAECNTYNAKALISEELLQKLSFKDDALFTKLDRLSLRGKKEMVQLYKIEF